MNDEQLDHILDRAGASYRTPPDPDLEALWRGIDARRGRSRASNKRTLLWWGARITGIAAALAIAFTLGRMTAGSPGADAPPVASSSQEMETPVTAVATELLGQTVVLLTALPEERSDSIPDQRFTKQAGALLTTTRLLLDSPAAANDARLHNLLEDLELVLAQIARLQKGGQARMELELITDALQQQDLVPRIRSIAAGLNAGD